MLDGDLPLIPSSSNQMHPDNHGPHNDRVRNLVLAPDLLVTEVSTIDEVASLTYIEFHR